MMSHNKWILQGKAWIKKTVLYELYKRIQYEENAEKEFSYNHMLSADEYRFLKYKKSRNNGYRIDLNRISIPCEKGLVSIVLPVFNGEDYIEESVQSVLAQTYKNIELIIIDDGSTDRTAEMIDQYRSDVRVKVVHQENRKLPRTLSRGFRLARGEYFTWTSADNRMHPEFVEKFVLDMKKYGHTAMLYGNLRLIDENGNAKTDFEWYRENGKPLEHVMLPKCCLELNTYPNNYIGAAFMYRAAAANVTEDYSAYKFGIEDYDYWMKINELFSLRHTSFDQPEYSYRLHDKSLTSKDKELKITENRFKQMLLDEFRRNYYLKDVGWIVLCEDIENEQCRELIKTIKRYGQQCLTLDEAGRQTVNLYERYICVCYGEINVELLGKIPANAFKILAADHPTAVGCLDIWDACVCRSKVLPEHRLGDFKGWFGIEHGEDLFAFADGKARNRFLYELEADTSLQKSWEKTFSIIISYHGMQEKLNRCIESIKDADAEIIIVGNCQEIRAVKERYPEGCQYIEDISGNDITCKNMAAYRAKGSYLVFIEDAYCFQRDYFKNLEHIFLTEKQAGTVFGNVEILNMNSFGKCPELFETYMIGMDGRYRYQERNIPSGYSFAVRNELFQILGGFYDFSERSLRHYFCDRIFFGAAMVLQNAGFYIYLSHRCIVYHDAEERSVQEEEDIQWLRMLYEYKFALNHMLPSYDVWPEFIAQEISELQDELAVHPQKQQLMIGIRCRERLLELVRADFREREQADLNRDLFSRLA